MKSSRISGAASTPNVADYSPFWNLQCSVASKRLWLPTKIDSRVTPSISSSLSSTKPVEGSWFSTSAEKSPTNSNFLKNSCVLSTVIAADTTVEDAKITTRKIKLYPTQCQRWMLNIWFSTSRLIYNETVRMMQSGHAANHFDL